MQYSNILLIDDDEDDQEIFHLAIQEVSNVVAYNAFNNAKTALQKLNNNELQPDVIFLDLNMPIMTGQEFLSEIKQQDALKSIPIIIISTSSQPETIAITKRLGAHDFITKPNKFDALVTILQTVLASGTII